MNKYKTLNVEVLYIHCKRCAKKVEKYKLNDFNYGERLLETEDGIDYAYVDCVNDSTFNEIGDIVDEIYKKSKKSEIEITKYFNEVFGYLCDFINEKRINASSIGFFIAGCKKEDCKVIEKTNPEIKQIKVPIITYEHWNSKNEIEKKEFVIEKLKELKLL